MARCLICNTGQNRFRRGAVNQDEIPVLKMIGDHIGQYSLIGTDGVYQLIGKIESRWNKLQVGATQPRVADKNVPDCCINSYVLVRETPLYKGSLVSQQLLKQNQLVRWIKI